MDDWAYSEYMLNENCPINAIEIIPSGQEADEKKGFDFGLFLTDSTHNFSPPGPFAFLFSKHQEALIKLLQLLPYFEFV